MAIQKNITCYNIVNDSMDCNFVNLGGIMNINDVYDKLDSLENDVDYKIATLQELVEAQSRMIKRLKDLLDGLDNRL